MLLARTDPDRSLTHRGLSMFVVEKPRGDGHGFLFTQEEDGRPADIGPGKLEGRPIDTLGYRGMHSYELAFENWFVPDANLVGGEEGLGKGFYLQMQGFENGRLQTAARALGVMQAAYEAARDYAANRVVFGSPIGDYQLTQAKLGRMAVIIQATRQCSYHVARLMANGEGALEASMVKAYVCRAAEWVHARSHADPRRHGLRRGVRGQPLLRRRPGALHLRGRRRDTRPEGHRPPAHRLDRLTEGRLERSRPYLPFVVATAFSISGVIHLAHPSTFTGIVPHVLPAPRALVYVSGVAELMCAYGLWRRRRWAGLAATALLLVVWPANLQQAITAQQGHDVTTQVLTWIRFPLQIPLIWCALQSGRTEAGLARAASQASRARPG